MGNVTMPDIRRHLVSVISPLPIPNKMEKCLFAMKVHYRLKKKFRSQPLEDALPVTPLSLFFIPSYCPTCFRSHSWASLLDTVCFIYQVMHSSPQPTDAITISFSWRASPFNFLFQLPPQLSLLSNSCLFPELCVPSFQHLKCNADKEGQKRINATGK